MISSLTINRSLLLVIPNKTFYDYSNTLFTDQDPVQASRERDHNSYLLEDDLFLDDPQRELKKYWKSIFLNKLFGQYRDNSTYPKLSWKLFTELFYFHQSSIITDLTDEPLYTEHYE